MAPVPNIALTVTVALSVSRSTAALTRNSGSGIAARLDAISIIEVVSSHAEDCFASLGKAKTSQASSDPARSTSTMVLSPPSLVARGKGAIRLFLFQRVSRVLFNATGGPHKLVGTTLVVVMLPRCVQDRGARVKAASADTNVLCVLLHLLNVFVVLPPVDESGHGTCVLMPLCHATSHERTGGRTEAIIMLATAGTVDRIRVVMRMVVVVMGVGVGMRVCV